MYAKLNTHLEFYLYTQCLQHKIFFETSKMELLEGENFLQETCNTCCVKFIKGQQMHFVFKVYCCTQQPEDGRISDQNMLVVTM
jgi:hypothetical protein